MRITTVDLLRHGACEGGEIFRGSHDVALSPEGWEQMRAALAGEGGWTRVVTSPLRRSRDFAAEFAERHGLPLRVDDELREIHFGDWEGREIEQVRRDDPEAWRAFWRDPGQAAAPGGEAMPDFQRRVVPRLEQLLCEQEGEHILMVSHGTVIRVIICEWLSMPLDAITRLSVPYGCLTRFRIYRTEGREPWMQLCFHRGE